MRTPTLVLLIAAWLLCLAQPLQAQPAAPPAPYTGLDILFLVDQSGSMGGRDFGFSPAGDGADPLGLRFQGVQYALDTLGEYKLNFLQDVPIQAAVINFGDQADSADWQQIAAGNDAAAWDVTRQQLLESLSALTFRAEHDPPNLGNTNFIGAFDVANTAFNQLPIDPTGQHLRAIILLTDGAPCVPSQFDCESSAAQQTHMDTLYELTQQTFPAPNHLIYVIALDATGDLWSRWQGDWQRISGETDHAARAESAQEIGGRFQAILRELVGEIRGQVVDPLPPLPLGENAITIPPFIREVRISIFKSSASPGVLEVLRPDGSPLLDSDAALSIVNRDRPIEVWTIRDPLPGVWTFIVGSSNDRIDVYLELIPIALDVEITGGSFIQGDVIHLTVQLMDENGSPLPNYGATYPLDARALITEPSGALTELPLATEGDLTYSTDVGAEAIGVYQVGVQISSPSADSALPILNEPYVGSFDVRGVVFQADTLPQGDLLAGDEIRLEAMLTDTNGAPLPFTDIEVTAEFIVNSLTTRALLQRTQDGNYVGAFTLTEAGTYDLVLTAVALRPDSNPFPLGEPITTRFNLLPSIPISLVQIMPVSAESSQYATEGLPPLSPTDMIIEFEVRGNDGVPLSLSSITSADSGSFALTLTQDGEPSLFPLPQPSEIGFGRYQLLLGDFPTGRFDIGIQAQGELTGTYIFDPAARALSITIFRHTNPLLYALGAVLGIAVLGVIMVSIWRLRRRQRLRRHIARGTIIVRDQASGVEIWRKDLDPFKSNSIVLRDKALRKVNLSELRVTCLDERMSEARRVQITALHGKDPIVKNRTLSPGGTPIALSKRGDVFAGYARDESAAYEIVKDIDTDTFR